MLRYASKLETPPGGSFPYRQLESGFRFRQIAFTDLLREIKDHRKANNFPIGPNFEAEVEDASCRELLELFPNYNGCVTEDGALGRPSGKPFGLKDIMHFLNFVAGLIARGAEFVDQTEADRRAEICLKCPKHVDSALCWGCNGISGLVQSIKGNRHTKSDEHLRYCGACHCDLKTKVWIERDAMKRDDVEWDEKCWMRD